MYTLPDDTLIEEKVLVRIDAWKYFLVIDADVLRATGQYVY